MKDKHAVEAVI